MKKKILITGSNGFLGSLAKEYFKKNYHLVFDVILNSKTLLFVKIMIIASSKIYP